MKKINKVLRKLKHLGNNNIVIGGTTALKLHGLILNKEPEDIDVIVYKPTKDQLKLIDVLKLFDDEICESIEYGRRSIKLNIDNALLNIVIEWHDSKPSNLLSFKMDYLKLDIQSVENVFKAQRSYNKRKKDLESSIKLKELNFNII